MLKELKYQLQAISTQCPHIIQFEANAIFMLGDQPVHSAVHVYSPGQIRRESPKVLKCDRFICQSINHIPPHHWLLWIQMMGDNPLILYVSKIHLIATHVLRRISGHVRLQCLRGHAWVILPVKREHTYGLWRQAAPNCLHVTARRLLSDSFFGLLYQQQICSYQVEFFISLIRKIEII